MENLDLLLEPLRALLHQVGEFLPRLALSLLVVILGWLVAKVTRLAAVKSLRAINFHILTDRAGLDGFLKQGGIDTDTTDIIATLAYWLVILAALVIGFNSVGLTYITELLREVVLFVPRVIVALLILAFGAYFARFVAGTVMTYCRNVGIQDAELLGKLAQYAIIGFVVLIALDQVQVGGDIVRQSFLIVLAGVVLALALAFGLGGQRWASDLLERWWSRRDPGNRK